MGAETKGYAMESGRAYALAQLKAGLAGRGATRLKSASPTGEEAGCKERM